MNKDQLLANALTEGSAKLLAVASGGELSMHDNTKGEMVVKLLADGVILPKATYAIVLLPESLAEGLFLMKRDSTKPEVQP